MLLNQSRTVMPGAETRKNRNAVAVMRKSASTYQPLKACVTSDVERRFKLMKCSSPCSKVCEMYRQSVMQYVKTGLNVLMLSCKATVKRHAWVYLRYIRHANAMSYNLLNKQHMYL